MTSTVAGNYDLVQEPRGFLVVFLKGVLKKYFVKKSLDVSNITKGAKEFGGFSLH